MLDFANSKFTKGDLNYCFKERKWEFSRFIKIYETIKNEALLKNSKSERIETGLNVSILSEKADVSKKVLKGKIKELKDMGIIDCKELGNETKIYFNRNCKNYSYLDAMLEKAKIEGLL